MSSHVDSQTAPINFLYSYLVGEVFFPLGRGKSPALSATPASYGQDSASCPLYNVKFTFTLYSSLQCLVHMWARM